jgi:hypothetical protein
VSTPPSGQKVFGIGLNKTGTSSLHQALEVLGYQSLHWGGEKTHDAVLRAIDEGEPLLRYVDPEPDAICDVFAVTYFFFLADVEYPGSKFILTLRDLDEWLDSRRRHVERNQQMKEAGEYDGSFLAVDLDTWASDFQRHEAVVRTYFAGRAGDLLAFRPADGDWEPLCSFLERPVPDVPFPWENRYRPWVSSGEVGAG